MLSVVVCRVMNMIFELLSTVMARLSQVKNYFYKQLRLFFSISMAVPIDGGFFEEQHAL